MFQEEVTLTFIFQTIGVVLALSVAAVIYVKIKAKKVK
jgi:hypothetical protein